jgi:hypothetical protein
VMALAVTVKALARQFQPPPVPAAVGALYTT